MPAIAITSAVGLGGVNRPADVKKIKTRLVELGFDWIQPDDSMGPTTVSVIRLFQAMKNGLHQVNLPQNDGRIDPGGSTLRWLNAANAPRWVLMPAGSAAEGYINLERADTSDSHDFGCSWLADALADAGKHYRDNHLATNPGAAVLAINDTSVPRGGDTPDHATHEAGMCCDLFLPRKDGRSGSITFRDAKYDQAAARAQIVALRSQPLADRVLFNDPVLVAEGLCRAVSGHDHHLHFDILAPAPIEARAMRMLSKRRARRP